MMSLQKTDQKSELKDFEILNKLGKGSFGVVYKVRRRKDNNIYVMKQINISKMNQKHREEAIKEVTIMSKLESEYIVKYLDSFVDKNNLCIVMEYCEQGDLHEFIKKQMGRQIPEPRIWCFFIEMCLGLEYLHRKKVLHRDIKAMNIFLKGKDLNVRIGDLGVAKVLQDTSNFAHTMVGTPYYLSPEMCEEKPYNEKSDVWALGCVLYELCTGRHPFDANNQGALILRIVKGRFTPIPSTFTKDLHAILDMCLNRNYKQRPTIQELLSQNIIIQKIQMNNINVPVSSVAYKFAQLNKKQQSNSNESNIQQQTQNTNIVEKEQKKIIYIQPVSKQQDTNINSNAVAKINIVEDIQSRIVTEKHKQKEEAIVQPQAKQIQQNRQQPLKPNSQPNIQKPLSLAGREMLTPSHQKVHSVQNQNQNQKKDLFSKPKQQPPLSLFIKQKEIAKPKIFKQYPVAKNRLHVNRSVSNIQPQKIEPNNPSTDRSVNMKNINIEAKQAKIEELASNAQGNKKQCNDQNVIDMVHKFFGKPNENIKSDLPKKSHSESPYFVNDLSTPINIFNQQQSNKNSQNINKMQQQKIPEFQIARPKVVKRQEEEKEEQQIQEVLLPVHAMPQKEISKIVTVDSKRKENKEPAQQQIKELAPQQQSIQIKPRIRKGAPQELSQQGKNAGALMYLNIMQQQQAQKNKLQTNNTTDVTEEQQVKNLPSTAQIKEQMSPNKKKTSSLHNSETSNKEQEEEDTTQQFTNDEQSTQIQVNQQDQKNKGSELSHSNSSDNINQNLLADNETDSLLQQESFQIQNVEEEEVNTEEDNNYKEEQENIYQDDFEDEQLSQNNNNQDEYYAKDSDQDDEDEELPRIHEADESLEQTLSPTLFRNRLAQRQQVQEHNFDEQYNEQIQQDDEEQIKQIQVQQQKQQKEQYESLLSLNLAQARKRVHELSAMIAIKVQECKQKMGEPLYALIISFFRNKLNSDDDLDEADQTDIDRLINQKMQHIPNYEEILYTLSKVLHLELEIQKSNNLIQSTSLKIENLLKSNKSNNLQ